MSTKSRILFVDDEPNILSSLRRLLRRQRSEWEMTFVNSAADALVELDNAPYDVIVSDMRMPHMSGDHLLAEVLRWHPTMARMILSGYSADESLLRSVGPAHELLCKPCDQETL
ncbi:response regulator, partial [Rhodothermus sp. AH-315-K08]|nr:response regulator [Rhodothermus sp. AH-315-K08]